MTTLYVTEPGARVEKEYRRIIVTNRNDEVLISAPLVAVSEVVLVGSVGVTTQALHALLAAGVGFSLIDAAGQLLGRLLPPENRNLFLRRQQYARAGDPVFCLAFSRAIAAGKLRNQRTLARRLAREHPEISIAKMKNLTLAIQQSETAADFDTLRGQEGLGAKAYFHIFRQALRPGWEFPKRTRRPPADPANALLSLGYTLLTHNILTALEVVGLDPYEGFFHIETYGRPALALDMMEEFRSLIVDSVVLTVVNKRILEAEDFENGPAGKNWLKPPGLRKFLAQYNTRLQTKVYHPLAKRKLTYQKCFEVQAWRLRKVIEGKEEVYVPFQTK